MTTRGGSDACYRGLGSADRVVETPWRDIFLPYTSLPGLPADQGTDLSGCRK